MTGGTVVNGTGGVQTLNVTGSGQYVRMNGTLRGTGWGYSLFELKVIGSFGTPPATCGTANVALGEAPLASSTQGANSAANAFDGNATATRWESLFTDGGTPPPAVCPSEYGHPRHRYADLDPGQRRQRHERGRRRRCPRGGHPLRCRHR